MIINFLIIIQEYMDNIAIKLENVYKSYKLYSKPGDRVKEAFTGNKRKYCKETYILNGINLEVKAGEVIGIVGTNGAGKSTLLKIITGVLTPTKGNVSVKGKVSALLELGTGFNPEFTGIKNIYLNGAMMGYTHEEMEMRIKSIIEFADIGDFIDQPVKTYSSGMFARLAFAAAINVDPEILIVDEALSVGDLRFQMKCMDKMKSMMDSGVTVLFVSHDINAIRRLCTKAAWVKNGIITEFEETNKVCDHYLEYLKLGDTTEPVNSPIPNAVEDSNSLKEFNSGKGELVAEIEGISILNKNHIEVNEVNLFSPIEIKIYYDVYDENVEAPVLGVALKRIDEEYICGINTLLDKIKIPWKYGRNSFSILYDEGLRVLGGHYYFDVALFDKTATVPIHYWARAKEVTVNATYIGEGICILPHRWSK